jgi:hypothetical protein
VTRRLAAAGRGRAGHRERASAVRRGAAALVACAALVGAGCVPLRGGWDSESLVGATPALARIPGQRLGDLVPFPAFGRDGQLSLVACRFAPGSRLRVRAGGPGWVEDAGGAALAAFAGQLDALGLRFERVHEGPAEIEIDAQIGLEAEGPVGLGDTLVECDIEAAEAPLAEDRARDPHADARASQAASRGVVAHAVIRMRRSGLDAAGRLRRASDHEWQGALLHELGHALGHSGHTASGRSLLVRDESRLTRIARDLARGEPLRDPNLAALYTLDPGQVLGERALTPGSAKWVERVRRLDAARRTAGNARVALLASAGDREARISFRYADGGRLDLRLPLWAERLRAGAAILAWPDAATFEVLSAALAEERAGRAPEPLSR